MTKGQRSTIKTEHRKVKIR